MTIFTIFILKLDRNEIMFCQTILSVSIWTISLVLAWGLMTPPFIRVVVTSTEIDM